MSGATGSRSLPIAVALPRQHEAVGLGYGSGFSSTALTTLKIAVFAPIPSASVTTATAVKPVSRICAAHIARPANFGEESSGTDIAGAVFDGVDATHFHQAADAQHRGSVRPAIFSSASSSTYAFDVGAKLGIAAVAAEQVAHQETHQRGPNLAAS